MRWRCSAGPAPHLLSANEGRHFRGALKIKLDYAEPGKDLKAAEGTRALKGTESETE